MIKIGLRATGLVAGCALLLALFPPVAHALAQDEADDRPATRTLADVLAASTPDEWRTLDPENTLYMEIDGGRVVIELAPAFAPAHADNIRTLVRGGHFDGGSIIRSQDNYVVQWAVATDSAGQPSMGEAATALPAEFTAPIGDLPFTPIPDGDIYAPEAGFTHGFPVGRDPDAGTTWLAHCYGVVGVARGTDPNSGSGASLYVVTGHAPRHLDRNLSMVGRVVAGIDVLSPLPRGSGPLGFYQDPQIPVPIRGVRVGTDVPAADRLSLEVLRTDSDSFQGVIEARRHRAEEFFVHAVDRIELCNVRVPTRDAAGD
ncbi:MAG: peptidylprolyl isomerase [Gemmatimonadota bacterium]